MLNMHSDELKKLFSEDELSLRKNKARISFGYHIWLSIMTYYTKVNNEKSCVELSMSTIVVWW